MRGIVAVFFILFSLAAHGQELRNHFDVPGRIENNILFNFWQNPALTGYEERSNLQLAYSVKWLGLYSSPWDKGIPPHTWFGTYDVAMGKNKNHSLGIVFNESRNSFERTLQLLLSYSGTIRIRKINQIRIGISAGMVAESIDWSKLSFPDMIDPNYGFIYNTNEIPPSGPTRTHPDFSAGVWYARKRFFLGFSAQHLFRPDNGIMGVSQIPMQLSFNSGYMIQITPQFTLTPSIIVMNKLLNKNNPYYTYSPAISLSFKNRYLVLLSYRNVNTLMIYGGAQLKENLRLSFGWGFATEKELRAIQSGQSIEVMLRYRFSFKRKTTITNSETEEPEK